MNNVSFIARYFYSLLSVSLWVVLIYLPFVYFSSRGHHLGEWIICALICCAVLILSFLMTLAYELISLLKMSPLKRDIIFVLCISYLYLPLSIFTMYKEGMVPSIFSMEMMNILFNAKLYILGVFVLPAPFLFVYLLRRAGRKTDDTSDINETIHSNMEEQGEGLCCYPLLFRLPVRLSGEYLATLSTGAALWGRRHGLLSFEDLVSHCCSNWRDGKETLAPLAGLMKAEYSEKGAQLLRQLEIEVLCDTEEAHRQYADEVIAAVYSSVLSQRRLFPGVAERVINSIAAEIDCVCDMEWTGYPETPPYLNDHGFSPAWVSAIFEARYLLQQANSFTTRLKFWFSGEKCLEDAWGKIEHKLAPILLKGGIL